MMIKKFIGLPLKKKILLSLIVVSVATILTFVVLYFCRVVNLVALCLATVIALFVISLSNLLNGSIEEDKKLFIYNLVFTCLIFACCISLVILLFIYPEALTR